MNTYNITYTGGGRPTTIDANSPLKAITKSAKKSIPDQHVRFFETHPKIESLYFIVKNISTKQITYYKMVNA